MRMLDALEDPVLRRSVEANGFNGAYLRFTGSVTVEDWRSRSKPMGLAAQQLASPDSTI